MRLLDGPSEAKAGKADADVACYMTTDACDAENDVVLSQGADLARFDSNPIVLFAHAQDRQGSIPVGKVVWRKVRPHDIMAGVRFARSSELGRELKDLVDEEMLGAWSIGFRSIESSMMTKSEAMTRKDWSSAYDRAHGKIRVHRRWELLELSLVPIPMNPEALNARYAMKGLDLPDWAKSEYMPEISGGKTDKELWEEALSQTLDRLNGRNRVALPDDPPISGGMRVSDVSRLTDKAKEMLAALNRALKQD